MSLPFQRHLQWLCLEGVSDKEISRFYDNVQLPLPTENDLAQAREAIKKLIIPPLVKRNLNRAIFKHEDTPTWTKLGYGDLHSWRCYSGEKSKADVAKAWNEVGRILSHPVMRTALDALLISKMEDEKIVLLLPQHFQIPMSQMSLDFYRRNFFDVTAYGKADWSDYLDRVREDSYVYIRLFTALTRPRPEVLHLCGLPTERQFSDFLRNVLAASNYKFDYYMRQNTPQADLEARRWAKVGFEAGEKFEKFGAGDVSDFSKLVQTEFEYVSPNIETITPETAAQMRPQLEEPKPTKKSE